MINNKDIEILINSICRRPQLYGVRNCSDIFYYIQGYCIAEHVHAINVHASILESFCSYVSLKLLNVSLTGKNWGKIIDLMAEDNKDAISLLGSLINEFTKSDQYYKNDHFEGSSLPNSFQSALKWALNNFGAKEVITLHHFIVGYSLAVNSRKKIDEQLNLFQAKVDNLNPKILRELRASKSSNLWLELSRRYYIEPEKAVEFIKQRFSIE